MKPKRPWQPRHPHGKPSRPHEGSPGQPPRPRQGPPGHGRPPRPAPPHSGPRTDWGQVASWYDELVGEEGSEYQQHIVHPGALRLLGIRPGDAVLDIACGQGVFCRILHEAGVRVTGVDAARELIKLARQRGPEAIRYLLGDARDLSMLGEAEFDAATCILAIQNINPIAPVFEGASRALRPGGRFVLVMMHPCFRGPKETSWSWDEQQKVQYRRVDRYMLPRKAPIVTNPGKAPDRYTWTFHKPLEAYIKALGRAELFVDTLEEWTSHKTTQAGPRAAAENLARKEIPLFMAVRAIKVAQASPGPRQLVAVDPLVRDSHPVPPVPPPAVPPLRDAASLVRDSHLAPPDAGFSSRDPGVRDSHADTETTPEDATPDENQP